MQATASQAEMQIQGEIDRHGGYLHLQRHSKSTSGTTARPGTSREDCQERIRHSTGRGRGELGRPAGFVFLPRLKFFEREGEREGERERAVGPRARERRER